MGVFADRAKTQRIQIHLTAETRRRREYTSASPRLCGYCIFDFNTYGALNSRYSRQHFPFKILQHSAPAGRDIAHFIGESEFVDSRYAISTAYK